MVRLPKLVAPTHYDLHVSLDLEALRFQGSVVAHLDVLQETKSIVLNSKELEITSTRIVSTSDTTTHIPADKLKFDLEQQTVTIPLGEALSTGSKIALHLTFQGTIKAYGETPGFQWTGYKTASGEAKRAYSTACEPIGARCIFQCLDEPEYKATIASAVTITQDLMCISNMDVASTHTSPSEDTETGITKRITFNKTHRTSTYLVCFVIGDFEFIQSTKLSFPVRVYALRGAKLQHGSYMLKVAVDALDRYQQLFGLAYPLPKLDLVALPDAGALENWGCIVFGERFILLDPETTAAKSWQMATETLCHEIAHQWFGNLVTMAWWDDLWLNEAFAEWAGFYVVDKMFPEWQYWLHFVAADPDPEAMAFYNGALDMDSTHSSHPIYNPKASPNRMGELFDNITYMKGASLLRMLCHCLGTDGFIDGVRGYLKKHAYSNATTSDLWDALATSTSTDVKRLMQEWTKNLGYPVISVTEDNTEGSQVVTLEQHRYLQSANVTPQDDKSIWHVPLNTATTKVTTREAGPLLLTSRQQAYPVDLTFYKINSGQVGLYRVAYPPSRLQKFGTQLSSGRLSPEDRAGLISDTHAFVSSSLPTPIRTADLLDFLWQFKNSNEENFLVWRQIFYTVSKLRQAFLFSSPEINKALQRFHQELTLSSLPHQVWDIKSNDPVPSQNEKALFFSQAAGYEPVNKVAAELFTKFMAGDAKAFNPNIRKYVFQAVTSSNDVDLVSETFLAKQSHPANATA
jgi:aminopeptidase 2